MEGVAYYEPRDVPPRKLRDRVNFCCKGCDEREKRRPVRHLLKKCACCTCGKPPPILKPNYRQPKRPESYAPFRGYVKPTAPLENYTTYKLSYLPSGFGDTRSPPVRPDQNLVVSCEPLQDATIHKLSFQPNPVCVTQPARPRSHDMWGKGPMSVVTTQRHDFVPKPIDLRDSFRPSPKYHCVEAPLDNRTINRLSYLNPGRIPRPTACKPVHLYEKCNAPIDCTTIQKMSYQPVQPQPMVAPPWASKGQYVPPTCRVDDATIYKCSYIPPGEDNCDFTDPCKPGECVPTPCNPPVEITPTSTTPTESCVCRYPKAEVYR